MGEKVYLGGAADEFENNFDPTREKWTNEDEISASKALMWEDYFQNIVKTAIHADKFNPVRNKEDAMDEFMDAQENLNGFGESRQEDNKIWWSALKLLSARNKVRTLEEKIEKKIRKIALKNIRK